MIQKRRVHYVLSTHWDREWYQTFQDYRYRLVQLLDRVLAGIADGRLRGPFTTDGQAIILDDYVEVRPERRAQIEQFARERKLVIGPWYVLPDEFLVSGESLIRNLRLGRQLARAWGGEPSNAGFVCDLFGHNSQMPQIFAGFGIRGGFVWRGLNSIQTRHVLWHGADGTELPCYRFGLRGYCSYAIEIRGADKPNLSVDANTLAQRIASSLEHEAAVTEVDPVLLFDGGDHAEWDAEAYAVLVGKMDAGGEPFHIVHSSLDEYLAEMLAQADRISTKVEGELREPALHPVDMDQQWLIPGVLSSRVWIKQANAECQTLLCQWAEPFSAFAHTALGCEHPQGYLDVAWKWLLQNHPHDSICGCSIDAVHQDMKYRFAQCSQIANRLATEATRQIAASVEGNVGEKEMRVVVFNPLPRPLAQTTELTLQIPADWPVFNEFFGFEPKPAFRIHNAMGNEIAYQRLGQAMNRTKFRTFDAHFPKTYATNDVRVSLPVQIPAMGYATFTVRAGEEDKPTRHPSGHVLATSERSMENEYLSVMIEANGSLTLTDKRTGQSYERLLTFEDCADIGDGWYHGPAVNDQVFASTACRSDIALVHNGPMLATFRIRTTMSVPAEFRFDTRTRSERLVELVIESFVSLRPGTDRVEVETTIHNTADDHRVRVLFPSGAKAETYLADSPFDVVERPITLRKDNHLYRELEVETKPQQSWTAVFDKQCGLAVISTGLLESAARDLPERPIALTLFRGTRRTVFTDGEPDGQLRGSLACRYWIAPLTGTPDRTRLLELGQLLAAGLRDVQLTAQDVALHRTERRLPATAGFLQLDGDAVMTSARQVGNGLEARIFNPTDKAAEITLRHRSPSTTTATRVDFESRPIEPSTPIRDGAFPLCPKSKQIVTVMFV